MKQIVELGVTQITFLQTDYSVAKLNNLDKINKQMIEALKQSQNAFLPKLNLPVPFNKALSEVKGKKVYGAMPSDVVKTSFQRSSEVNLFVGPEGGFSKQEKEKLNEVGEGITVGTNILRIETAVISLIAKIL